MSCSDPSAAADHRRRRRAPPRPLLSATSRRPGGRPPAMSVAFETQAVPDLCRTGQTRRTCGIWIPICNRQLLGYEVKIVVRTEADEDAGHAVRQNVGAFR